MEDKPVWNRPNDGLVDKISEFFSNLVHKSKLPQIATWWMYNAACYINSKLFDGTMTDVKILSEKLLRAGYIISW